MTTVATAPKGFYGWWILTGLCLPFGLGVVFAYLATIFFPSMQKELALQSSDMSLILSVTLWCSLISGPVSGWLTDKLGCRRTLLIGCATYLVGGTLLANAQALWQVLAFWCIFASFGQAIMVGTASQVLLRRWFMKKAGVAMSILMVAGAIVTATMFPVLGSLAANYGFRPVMTATVLVGTMTCAIIIFFVLKDSPESIGQHMDGMTEAEKNAFMTDMTGKVLAEKNNTVAEAIRMPQFWLWTACVGLFGGIVMGILGNITMLATSVGVPAASAGMVMMYFTIVSIIGRVTAGFLADKFGKRPVLMTFNLICALTLFGGYLFAKSPASMSIFAACLGLSMYAPMVLLFPWLGDLFGRLNMGKIMGAQAPIGTLISGAIPMTAGYIRSSTGSFSLFLAFAGSLMLVMAVLVFFIRPSETMKINMGMMNK